MNLEKVQFSMKKIRNLKQIAIAIQFALGSLLIWWLIHLSGLNIAQVLEQLARISIPFFLLGILFFVTATYINALRYRLFLPTSISTVYLVRIVFIQNALLTFIPWRIGEIGFPLMLRNDHGVTILKSGSLILAIRVIDLLLLLAIILLFGRNLGLEISNIRFLLSILLVLILLSVFIWIGCKGRISHKLQDLRFAFEMLGSPIRFGKLMLLSFAFFFISVLQTSFILSAVGLTLSFSDTGLLNALSLLISIIPIHPPGGWGTMDSAQIWVLRQLGYDIQIVISGILIAHVLYSLMIAVGGIIGWLLRGFQANANETAL